MAFQIFFTLCQRLWVRIDCFNLIQRSLRNSKQNMLHFHALFPDDIQLIFRQKIVNIRHNTLCRVFDRQYCIICFSRCNFFHSISECFYMVTIDRIRKIRTHGSITVSTFYSLKNNIHPCHRKCIYHLIIFCIVFNSIFGQ